MSILNIEIPDDRWFSSENDIRPQDKQLCVVIPNWGNKIPIIVQWRELTKLFYIMIEKRGRVFIDDIVSMNSIDKWKPLGLPKQYNDKLCEEIEMAFEGE